MGDRIKVLQHRGTAVTDASLKVTRIEKRAGLGKVQLQTAVAGDVISLAGAGDAAGIADTIAAPAVEHGLDPGPIDPPTLRSAPQVHQRDAPFLVPEQGQKGLDTTSQQSDAGMMVQGPNLQWMGLCCTCCDVHSVVWLRC